MAAALTVSTHPRDDAAPCKWSSDQSTISIAQDDGYTVWVAASGQNLGPQASFAGGGKPDVTGTLWGGNNTINGNTFTFTVGWSNRWYSRFDGAIEPDGTAHGGQTSYAPPGDPEIMQPPVQWHSLNKFVCV